MPSGISVNKNSVSFPPGTELSPRNPGVPAWDELDDDQQRLFARMQETFAAFLDHTDHQIGRFVDHLKQSGELDNTLIVLLSDNGASQEGGSEGVVNELAYFNRIPQRTPDMIDKIDEIGGPNLYNNYPRGWSQVGNCPLRFYKQNTYEGGVRDPLIVHWPDRISDGGGVRDHYHHVIDVMPTVLRAVGVDAPDVRRGIEQQPIEGVDMTYTFDDPESESRRSTQYYEMLGHRAIYHEGWKAVTLHRPGQPFDEDVWHLYHVEEDFAEIHDLANSQPEKLAEMQQRWWDEAERYGVLPLDDRSVELFSLRRPDSELDRNRIDLAPGTPHLDRFSMPDLRNRSWRITASVERSADDDGVIVAAGSRIGGYSFFVRDGRAVFAYNHIGTITEFVTDAPLPTGAFDLVADFAKTAEHQGRLTIRIGSETLASGDLRTLPWRQAMYGLDIGRDLGSTVTPSYAAPNNFAGAIHLVRYDLDDDRSDRAAAARVESQNALAEQ